MNNKHVYLKKIMYNTLELCVGNDVEEVNDILSQIYTTYTQEVMFVSPCLVETKRNYIPRHLHKMMCKRGIIALIRKSLEI